MVIAQALGTHLMRRLAANFLAAASLAGTAAQANDYYLVLTGLGGETYYDETFRGRAADLGESLARLNTGAGRQWILTSEQSNLEAIEALFAELKRQMQAGDRLQLYLVGHGSYDGESYKFNIGGPDLTGQHLRELLASLPSGPQLVVSMTSSSGVLQELLADDQRIVITATRSGNERNAPVFGDYWVAGLGDSGADANRNELLSAGELYAYTLDQVARHYESDNLLASEHALVSDAEGANAFVVSRLGLLASTQLSNASEALLQERLRLEGRIQQLIDRRSQLPESEYFDQLQSLMLELGRVQQRLDNELGSSDAR